jgi:hypothetical protein
MLARVMRRVFFCVSLTTLVAAIPYDFAAAAPEISADTRAQLQLALREHIADNTAGETYRYFDPDRGETRLFRLKHLHPVIFEKDGFFLMCADFRDAMNDDVILDYVLHQSGDGFLVDQIVKGRRSFLTSVFERVF